jgi:hypothetical protein
VISRHYLGSTSRVASWALAVVLAVPAASPPVWTLQLAIHYLPPITNHSQYDVVLAGPGQTWFLGGTDIRGHGKPKAERIKNGIPHASLLPAHEHSWITAASAPAPTDIWAVTFLGGYVLHWNGSSWRAAPRGNWKAGTRFTGITAIAATNVWVFGTGGRLYHGAGTWHFNGTKWTRVFGPGGGVFQASAAAKTDIWAIGNAGRTGNALLHSGGSTWQRVRPAALAGFTYTHVLALSRFNVWVAGLAGRIPKLAHFDGHGWRVLRMPGRTAATGMCRDGRGGLWVIANTGRAPSVVHERSQRGTWTTARVSANPADEVLACALTPGTRRAWGAGKAAAPQGSAAAAYRTG